MININENILINEYEWIKIYDGSMAERTDEWLSSEKFTLKKNLILIIVFIKWQPIIKWKTSEEF